MNCDKKIDPRVSLYVVLLLGTSAFFMNKPLTAHLIFVVALLYAISTKSYKACTVYAALYGIVELLIEHLGSLHNQMLVLVIIMFSYFLQKFIVLLLMGLFMVHTVPLPQLLTAMQVMRFPDAILIPFAVALRFFPTIKQEQKALSESLKIRKVPVSIWQFFIHPIRSSEYLIVPILMRSLKTADELSASALVRGIESSHHKTILYPLAFKRVDYIIAALTTTVAAALFYLQYR
ncbi:MAG: energy-coupling factor transporter transmembrane protein EcfT [Treponema sp.]|nr:energy-coupling factor transporter transmembrane protein EcfT [Treponema sp.]